LFLFDAGAQGVVRITQVGEIMFSFCPREKERDVDKGSPRKMADSLRGRILWYDENGIKAEKRKRMLLILA
jgi:hypothetical protein